MIVLLSDARCIEILNSPDLLKKTVFSESSPIIKKAEKFNQLVTNNILLAGIIKLHLENYNVGYGFGIFGGYVIFETYNFPDYGSEKVADQCNLH